MIGRTDSIPLFVLGGVLMLVERNVVASAAVGLMFLVSMAAEAAERGIFGNHADGLSANLL